MHVAMHGVIRPHQDSSRASASGQPGNATTFASLIDNLPGDAGGGSNAKTPPVGGGGGGNPTITPPVGTPPPADVSKISNLPAAFGGDASMLADMVPAEGGGTIVDPGAPSRSNVTGPPSSSDSLDIAEEMTATAGTAAVSTLQALLLLSEI